MNDYESINQDKHDEFVRQESRYDVIDAMNDAIYDEFENSYTLQEFIGLYQENGDFEMSLNEFKQELFNEYKEHRLS